MSTNEWLGFNTKSAVNHMFKLMLIEDDETLFKEIEERLTQWSYQVFGIEDFGHVFEEFIKIKPDLVIIDIQLPKFDGFHWCRMIRNHSNVPIVFLSSRDHPTDMVMSMQLGADDFIQKPFHFDVLIAKVQAILRRVYNYNTERIELKTWRGATVDYETNTVTYENETIELTKNELFILKQLIEHKNKIVSREQLIRSLWDDQRFISDNTLTVNVNRLRKKLDELRLGQFIETKVGQGYIATDEGTI
ncbi:Response regulator protein GraR [Halalkalibacter krulwichiae]|uniref:Response regulator protein GraR n=2 Tax=Halalkalibacter krulwichiae TaxID=199441 RepID=A0A1X9MGR6_9BACI|nr:Response regulator protein GraR [Halalkalibacter krulwichiae]